MSISRAKKRERRKAWLIVVARWCGAAMIALLSPFLIPLTGIVILTAAVLFILDVSTF